MDLKLALELNSQLLPLAELCGKELEKLLAVSTDAEYRKTALRVYLNTVIAPVIFLASSADEATRPIAVDFLVNSVRIVTENAADAVMLE